MINEGQVARNADIVFVEEMPTTDMKSMRLLPVKLDDRIVSVVGQIESLVEKIGQSNADNTAKISNIILDLSSILEKMQKQSPNKDIFDRINDIYYKLDSTQLDDTKIYEIGGRIEALERKIDAISDSISLPATVRIDESSFSGMEDRLRIYLEEVLNELAATMSGGSARIEELGSKVGLLSEKINSVSDVISSLSIEQITDKLQMLSEIDKRSAYLEDIANELTANNAKESARMDRLEKYIDQTTIESENLKDVINEIKLFTNKIRKRYSKTEREILDSIKQMNESTNAIIDSVILNVLESGEKKLPELESMTKLSPALLERRLRELVEVRVRLRGEGKDVICSLIR